MPMRLNDKNRYEWQDEPRGYILKIRNLRAELEAVQRTCEQMQQSIFDMEKIVAKKNAEIKRLRERLKKAIEPDKFLAECEKEEKSDG